MNVVSNSFWDVEVSGISASDGGLGLSTEQMYDASTYIATGWDFAAEQRNGILDMWMASEDSGYPVLSAFAGAESVWLAGEGSSDSPYIVSTPRELAAMVYYEGSRYFDLVADLDLSTVEWEVPVLTEFEGRLDGAGHIIRGFRQEGSCGLFGRIDSGAMVTDLHLEEVQVEASDETAGCLAAENYGQITRCSVAGFIRGGTTTGGLVGYNQGDVSECSFAGASMGDGRTGGLAGENAGTVINSFSEGAVAGDSDVGGLAGLNSASIRSCFSTASVVGDANLGGLLGTNSGIVTDCYARGAVAGASDVGGLIGRNGQDVLRCYSTGAVHGLRDVGGLIGSMDFEPDSVIASFWDVDASQVPASAAGTGVGTPQMQQIELFLDAGWDFVEETANGTEDLWLIGPDGYPDLTLSLKLRRGGR